MDNEILFWYFVLLFGFSVLMGLVNLARTSKVKKLAKGAIEITPQEFLKLRKQTKGNRNHKGAMTKNNFEGIYILYNQTKNMYYVGQAKKVLGRVNNHFTGKGNGDVYADYKYGDSFTIKMIPLKGSGFSTLNSLEKNAIASYNSYAKGYNKTRGNKA